MTCQCCDCLNLHNVWLFQHGWKPTWAWHTRSGRSQNAVAAMSLLMPQLTVNHDWWRGKPGNTILCMEEILQGRELLPSDYIKKAIENAHLIVSFPIKNGDFP